MAKLHSFAVTGPYAVSEQVFDEYDRVKLANLDHVESLESVLTPSHSLGTLHQGLKLQAGRASFRRRRRRQLRHGSVDVARDDCEDGP